MPLWWIYTGNTEQEAQTKAQNALNIINTKLQTYTQDQNSTWAIERRLTANPEIEGNTYYYGFQKPYPNLIDTSTCDLEQEYSIDWIIQEPE